MYFCDASKSCFSTHVYIKGKKKLIENRCFVAKLGYTQIEYQFAECSIKAFPLSLKKFYSILLSSPPLTPQKPFVCFFPLRTSVSCLSIQV